MHIHLPKPIHGWREFFGEVGIIVLGVLIALTAEQIIEAWHWRGEVRELEDALNKELAYDMAALHYRVLQSPCIGSRLGVLDQWREANRSQSSSAIAGEIGVPALYSIDAGVWNARTGEAMAHMPIDRRVKYSALYDGLANTQALFLQEREAWQRLNEFNGAYGPLNGEASRQIVGLVYRTRGIDRTLQAHEILVENDGAKLGVRANFGSNVGEVRSPKDSPFCHSLPVKRVGGEAAHSL